MDIKIISWNYQGAGHLRFHNIIKEYRKDFSLNLICLLKAWVSGIRADGIISKLEFLNFFRVEANRFVEGIWIC